jgi:hypothetical protein
LRALSAATGLLMLFASLEIRPLFAQNIPVIPKAPATPEEARASQGSESVPGQGNAGIDASATDKGILGVPTAGAVSDEPSIPATLDFSLPEGADQADSNTLKIGNTSILYDAKSIGFDKTGINYTFDGDIVLIGAGYVITADSIAVNTATKIMHANGHVLIIHQNQVFSGEAIELAWESNDFVIKNALLVASDPAKIREVSQSILGLTPEELAYEAAKKARLQTLQKERDGLLEDFRRDPASDPSTELVERYTRLLEEDLITAKSLAPSLAQQDSARRNRFERRRIFWERGREEAAKDAIPTSVYFRLQGESLERRDGNTYTARDAFFTPCICADDESPAWGFQADEIVAQQEGYINLKHPILTIKGVPLIYLPYLKLPLKSKRQSGFLMPSFQSGQVKNGFVYSQPVFLDFGPNADATVTADLFQKRGTRVGLETRYEAKTSSGFRYQAETIRDRSWLEQSGTRRDLIEYFSANSPQACIDRGLSPSQCIESEVKDILTPPSNTWRGKQDWEGRYNFAPRLSLVTKGKIVSDHRYLDDLYLPEEVVTAFAPKANANAFSTAKAKLNFDGRDFFLGVKSSYGDNSLYSRQYAGQQLPSALTLQSRYFRLFPASWWSTPTYGEFKIQSASISENRLATADQVMAEGPTLGAGSWNRLGFRLITPLMTEGIFKIAHFADAELRYIKHNKLAYQTDEVDTSTIRSWKTGINIDLPIDGIGRLPSLFQSKDSTSLRYAQHIMNWGLTLSQRPVVIRDGPYGDLADENGAPLVYFPSDRNRLFTTEDVDVRDEDTMVKHERITLSTSHRWRFFERQDQVLPARPTKVAGDGDELDNLQEQARRDLYSVKDRSVNRVEDLYAQDQAGRVDWLIRRYQSTDQNSIEPITFSAQISYDREQERLRRKQIEENARLEQDAQAAGDPVLAQTIRGQKTGYYALFESWIGPTANLGLNYKGFSLDSSVFYNLYKKTSTSLGFALGLPTFYSTQFGLRYVLEKKANLDPGTDTLLFARTRTTTVGIASTLIPMIALGANLIRDQVDGQEERYGTSYQIGYDDRSGCWGLRFLREKDLNQPEEDANYILQLAVIFLGNRRGVDISPGLERRIRGDEAVRESNR